MPNTKWSQLNHMQLGQCGEYYAKMEFISYGYEVYTSEVDDHGVDFVVKDTADGTFYEVQVKSVYKSNYAFIPKDKIVLDETHLVCFLHFEEGMLPEVYLIPAAAWKHPNALLADYNYDKPGQKSKPEWGIHDTKKNRCLLEQYRAERFFQKAGEEKGISCF